MTRLAALISALLWCGPGPGQAQIASLFSDPKASRIGDVLTVIISENASATNQTATSTDKSNQVEVSSSIPGAGNILDFIPLHALQSDASNQYEGRASTSRSSPRQSCRHTSAMTRMTSGALRRASSVKAAAYR